VRAARNCAGSGRREHNREGRAAMSLYDEGIESIIYFTNVQLRQEDYGK
jgi:hypothetical protein